MRIACLQFDPSLGEVELNIAKADEILKRASASTLRLDLLVLPELALTGYNFPSLDAIQQYLEPTACGTSTNWAVRTAANLDCTVVVGYAEDASSAPVGLEPIIGPSPLLSSAPYQGTGVPVVPNTSPDFPLNFNSCVAVNPSGSVLAHYRKSSIYYTDATWAREGSGFWAGTLPFRSEGSSLKPRKAAMGICMDLNSHNFTNPWEAFEFGHHVADSDAEIVLMPMAWLSQDLSPEMLEGSEALEPDTRTVTYWIDRFRPLLDLVDGKVRIIVMANRCGVEGDVCYTGTSTVIGVKNGEVWIWNMCGKKEERLLVVDTESPPKYVLRTQHKPDDSDEDDLDEIDEHDSEQDTERGRQLE